MLVRLGRLANEPLPLLSSAQPNWMIGMGLAAEPHQRTGQLRGSWRRPQIQLWIPAIGGPFPGFSLQWAQERAP